MRAMTKAVFPVAGFGSRFLPATKASPKEMMPVVDKPLIQYAVEEAVAAGLTEMIFVTGRHKRAIEDHFDKAYEIENELASRGQAGPPRPRAGDPPAPRELHLHPPVRAARPRARGAVREAGDQRRAVRGDPCRRPDRRRSAGDEADGRRVRARGALGARRAGGGARANLLLRHREVDADRRAAGIGRGDRREAASRRRRRRTSR